MVQSIRCGQKPEILRFGNNKPGILSFGNNKPDILGFGNNKRDILGFGINKPDILDFGNSKPARGMCLNIPDDCRGSYVCGNLSYETAEQKYYVARISADFSSTNINYR